MVGWLDERQELSLRYDEKLTAVSEAVSDFMAVSFSFTDGVIPSFPLPALRLKGEEEDVLLPVGPSVARKLTENAQARSTQNGTAWEIDSSALEPLNPEWDTMVNGIVESSVREDFGIASGVPINAKLTKLVLHTPGSQIENPTDAGRVRGVFGTMVLVLPGEFEEGGIENETGLGLEGLSWHPHEEKVHDIKFAAFYNASVFETSPVKRGNILWLEYELSTSLLDQVPLFVSHDEKVDAVVESLEECFDEPMPNKLPISGDMWELVKEFLLNRHFVHEVSAGSFRDITDREYDLAQVLDDFCRKSNGKFILYLCRMECERVAEYECSGDDEACFTIKLNYPWTRFDEDEPFQFRKIFVDHSREVSPVGFVETAEFRSAAAFNAYDYDDSDSECRDYYSTYALVIQPVSIEMNQWAKLPEGIALSKLENLVVASAEQASAYARRVVRTAKQLTNRYQSISRWLAVAESCNDLELWEDVILKTIHFGDGDSEVLVSSIHHFGWDTCKPVMRRLIPKLRSRPRVQFIGAALKDCKDSQRIEQLLDDLIESAPRIDYDKFASYSTPTQEELSRIFELAYSVSISKLASILPRCDAATTTAVILPSFRLFLKRVPDQVPLAPLLEELVGRQDRSP